MKNRIKPGSTRSYAANGGSFTKSDSPKDGTTKSDIVAEEAKKKLEEAGATVELR